ncbi:oxygen-insensitive NADPH nitroreductase [Alkalihalobacterium bogoriense]|uniref:oxygen-insensitive NADPH nitroreductase n=1 Tax=Alkalihalobacterium bogoriense TaxID=246272 RepID=UPI000478E18B|nr:oxygen-insensitive NADPH nitroreductase [Alkalihalobacterium bogoriense]
MNETIETMLNHKSIRKFEKGHTIPEATITAILEAGQSAATSHFIQAYSIIRVKDRSKVEGIAELSQNLHIKDASAFFVFCADMKRLEYASRKHHLAFDYDSLENTIATIVDVALVAQNVMTAAESLGYGGCYIGGVRNAPFEISEKLELPDKVLPIFGLTLGVPVEGQEVKPRLPLSAIVHEDRYDETKYDDLLQQYDEVINEYYAKRTSNKKDATWTKPIASFFSAKKRVHMRDFFEKKGFTLK